MRDLLTYDECCELRRDYNAGKDLGTVLKAAARLGAERERMRYAQDVAIAEVVWRFIDRMGDVAPPTDSAERILQEFVAAVDPLITTAIRRDEGD